MPFRGHGWVSESWWAATAPATGPTGTTAIWTGLDFGIEVEGLIEGFRHYVAANNDGGQWGILFDANTKEVLRGFHWRIRADVSANAWHQTWIFPRLKHTDTNRRYRLATMRTTGQRFQTSNLLTSPVQHGNITFLNGWTSTALGIELANPTLTANAPGIDVLFHAT